MLRKLIKHEFKATYKTFGLIFVALMVLALLSRFCIYIPFENVVYEFMSAVMTVVYMIATFGISLISVVLIIKRFSQNMLRDEGYLTHTLPVKTWQHLLAKGLTYTVWMIASVIAMLGSLFVYFVGTDEFSNFIKSFGEVLNEMLKYPSLVGLCVFFLIIMIAQVVVNIYAFFAALSLGQIFKKHKIFGAVVFYFVLNYATSFLVSAAAMLVPNLTDKMNTVLERAENAKTVAECVNIVAAPFYAYFAVSLVIDILLGVLYFFISNYMLSKKLNLE
ncbi:MAG: hypothetical protein IJA27_03920 [Lachnospiraceae bacterium]|nr:hypothetical protein [Lachnospiraceae bacterium]